MKEEKILKIIEEFDRRFERIAKRLEQKLVTKAAFNSKMDEIMAILIRLDKKRIFTAKLCTDVDKTDSKLFTSCE